MSPRKDSYFHIFSANRVMADVKGGILFLGIQKLTYFLSRKWKSSAYCSGPKKIKEVEMLLSGGRRMEIVNIIFTDIGNQSSWELVPPWKGSWHDISMSPNIFRRASLDKNCIFFFMLSIKVSSNPLYNSTIIAIWNLVNQWRESA